MRQVPKGRSWIRRRLLLASLPIIALLVGVAIYSNSRQRLALPFDEHPAGQLLRDGRTAIQRGRFPEALDAFDRAESEGGELPIPILFDRAQVFLKLAQTTAAEQQLRDLLAREPRHIEANELLCGLLRVAGRNWEIRPYFLEMVRQDVFSAGNLAAITSNDNVAVNRGPPNESQFEQFLVQTTSAKGDILSIFGQARHLLGQNKPERALPLLRQVVNERSDLLDAQARLGALLLDADRAADFSEWHRSLPKNASQHPDLWFVRGRWAEQSGDRRGAARCYWETLRLFPDHPSATYRLSQALFALNHQAEAAELAERAGQINMIQTAIATGWSPPSNIQALAERLETLGRLWESLAWSVLTLEWQNEGNVEWATQRVNRLRDIIKPDTPLVLDSHNLALKMDFSDWPIPVCEESTETSSDDPSESSLADRIKFVDAAQEAGITFRYHNGADPTRAYMFEFGGGGVAVLDYDGDGWPDLYLTQGCDWPVSTRQQQYEDRLFRNLGNGRFADVTQDAGLRSTGFGQGVAAGDLNNDGWPDLYIANIGLNQLYLNNGDGTFTDITEQAGVTGSQWTLSTLIADLNGDSWPELYDVNYLGGAAVFEEICYRDGQPIQCFPNQFPGEQDRVYQSQGDGAFRDVTQQAGIVAPDGKGMGVVAADFDGSRRLSLFIANDGTNNFFFLNQTASPGTELKYSEMALRAGLALSESGTARSCMGIAVGDMNGDDRLDLFVTNFRDEANNLYVQDDDLLFDDRIRSAKLHDPGYRLEGWGAQFLDADLDGWLDLAVANGHLDDYPHSPGIKRMPTQVFRNDGGGRFSELPAKTLGAYFEGTHLGRALARLDWNRDGRPDFCVTHVSTPFALLTNQSQPTGNYLTVYLRGVTSARDAIGTTVSVRVLDRKWSLQLAAGDGFQASNQRHLVFGLGTATQVDELSIQWAGGTDEVFTNVAANREILCIEGRTGPPLELAVP